MKAGIVIVKDSGGVVYDNYIEGCQIGVFERNPLHIDLGLKVDTPNALLVQILTEADDSGTSVKKLEALAYKIGLHEWLDTAPDLGKVALQALLVNKLPGTRSLIRAMRSRIPSADQSNNISE